MAKRVLIVGAGVIGASIAWHLARAGAEVTVLDGGAAGGLATRTSWAWINASWGNPEPYFHLRERAMLEAVYATGLVAESRPQKYRESPLKSWPIREEPIALPFLVMMAISGWSFRPTPSSRT